MTASEILPPDPPEEPTRTAWETEHVDDPRDDAGTYVEVRLPGFDKVPRVNWRALAEEYKRERDYLVTQVERLEDECADLRRAYYGIER